MAFFLLSAVSALGASYVLAVRLERLAGQWGMSEALLGLVVALAADSPEITSAVTAAVAGHHDVGAGVVLGSNVFNLAALLGLGALVAGRIALHRRVIVLEGIVAVWVAAVAVLVAVVGVPAWLGLLLVLVVVAPYLASAASPRVGAALPARLSGWVQRAVGEEELEVGAAIHPVPAGRADGWVALLSGAAVIGASMVMEAAAESLGRAYHLSSLVVGGVVLAAATSLPNAVGAVYLAGRGRGSAVLSEAMNSNMLNVVVGLLLPGLFLGLGSPDNGARLVASWYAGLTVVSLALAYTGQGLSRLPGSLIVAGYVPFVVIACLNVAG